MLNVTLSKYLRHKDLRQETRAFSKGLLWFTKRHLCRFVNHKSFLPVQFILADRPAIVSSSGGNSGKRSVLQVLAGAWFLAVYH